MMSEAPANHRWFANNDTEGTLNLCVRQAVQRLVDSRRLLNPQVELTRTWNAVRLPRRKKSPAEAGQIA
ncbi:MAG: hypothetical protein WBW61_00195 [Rhodanobacteraceae bacterium]